VLGDALDRPDGIWALSDGVLCDLRVDVSRLRSWGKFGAFDQRRNGVANQFVHRLVSIGTHFPELVVELLWQAHRKVAERSGLGFISDGFGHETMVSLTSVMANGMIQLSLAGGGPSGQRMTLLSGP
jgi:hypothetical protein